MSSSARPKRFGPYDIVGKIGGGGMAAVFLGRKRGADGGDELAAIKVIRAELAAEEQFVTMFADEAKILSRLDHPNISRTLEVGQGNHLAFIAMELLLGRTLADLWDAARTTGVVLPLRLSAWICAQVARGLHYAHELADDAGQPFHLVHRDVNPSNVFLTYGGAIKLFDFGLAKAQGRKSHTLAGIVKGKVPYLSPEQLLQLPLDRRSDIFSLGTTLWEMTTMRRLFKRGSDLETILAIRDHLVPDPSLTVEHYPAALWTIVQRSLAPDREERYSTAAELAADLETFVESSTLEADAGHSPASDGSPRSVLEGQGDFEGVVGALLDRLFPGERGRQAEWLAHAVSLPANKDAVTMMPPAPMAPVSDARAEISIPLSLVTKKQ